MANSPSSNPIPKREYPVADKSKKKVRNEVLKEFFEEHSVWDFFDSRKPWVLIKGGSFIGFFDFVPEKLRIGPWSKVASASMVAMLSFFIMEGINFQNRGGFFKHFESSTNHEYIAFNNEWYFTLVSFIWMIFVAWHVLAYSHAGAGAWMTFTLWSWTTVLIRHGLCLAAPFYPSVRLPCEVLRFPALLSATITTFLWNFVLFPIVVFLMKDKVKRRNFLNYMTNFRLTQLHVFNIVFATPNGALLGPTRLLHYGDVGAAATMFILYAFCYYGILDRLGIHLYPIFSPRTPYVVFSYALIFGMCYGGYHGWQKILRSLL